MPNYLMVAKDEATSSLSILHTSRMRFALSEEKSLPGSLKRREKDIQDFIQIIYGYARKQLTEDVDNIKRPSNFIISYQSPVQIKQKMAET